MNIEQLTQAVIGLQQLTDKQAGQLLAAHAAVRGLLQAHPAPDAAQQAAAQQMEWVYASAQSRAVSEHFLAGIAQAIALQQPGAALPHAAPGSGQ